MTAILPRYLLVALLGTFLSSIGILSAFALPPAFLSTMFRLGGSPPGVVLGFLPMLAAELLPVLLPSAFLLGVTRTLGNMVASREWIAVQMTGRHPARVLLPVFAVALSLSATSSWILQQVVPRMRLAQEEYRRSAATEAARSLLTGRTLISLGGFTVIGRALDGQRIVDAVVRLPGETGETGRYILASEVEIVDEIDRITLFLEQARSLLDTTVVSLGSIEVDIPIDHIVRRRPPNPNKPTYLTAGEIGSMLAHGEVSGRQARRLAFERQQRWALSASYVVYALFGVLLGLRLGTDSLLAPLACTVGLSGAHYVLFQNVGRDVALSGTTSVWLGAWLADIVIFGLALLVLVLGRWRCA